MKNFRWKGICEKRSPGGAEERKTEHGVRSRAWIWFWLWMLLLLSGPAAGREGKVLASEREGDFAEGSFAEARGLSEGSFAKVKGLPEGIRAGEEEHGGYIRGEKVLIVSASDAGAGLAEYPYSFDGGRTWTADPEYRVKENGVCEALVRDAVGNVTRVYARVDRIDNRGPEVSFLLEPEPWYEGKAVLRILAEDEEAGLHERAYSYDGGKTWQFFGQLVLEKPGEIHVLVRDAVGNCTEAVYQARRQAGTGPQRPDSGRKGCGKHASGCRGFSGMGIFSAVWSIPGLAAGMRLLVKFFHTAAGRVVLSITAAAALLSLSGSLFYFAWAGVRVYGYDGRKRYAYLGRVLLREGEEGLWIRIPEKMTEEARTKEYRLRPGSLLVWRHGGSSLLVEQASDGKRILSRIRETADCSFELC